MNKYKNFLFKNFIWKIISLILAFILWTVGMNINNPEVNKTISTNLQLLNDEYIENNGLIILNYNNLLNEKVKVEVRATKNNIDQINSNTIFPFIDLKPYSNNNFIGEEIELAIHINDLPYGYELLGYSPKTITVSLDELDELELDIIPVKNGEPKEGYASLKKIEIRPETVKIQGPETVLNSIDKVTVDINLDNVHQNFSEKADIIVYDIDNINITDDLSLSNEQVNIYVEISKYATVAVNEPEQIGTLPNDVEIRQIIYSPKIIEIVGTEEDVDLVQSINSPNINLNEIHDDTVINFEIYDYLPSNVEIRNGTVTNGSIIIYTNKRLEKEFTVYIDELPIKNLVDGVVFDEQITLTVVGYEEDISELTIDDLNLSLDLSNIIEGNNEIKLNYNLPLNISFLNDTVPTVNVFYEQPENN